MTADLTLSLRILYTINSSPQYILARSPSFVPVTSVPTNLNSAYNLQSSGSHRYGTVTLKICLETIFRSSPELVQDKTRDYSVYVLDPLESFLAPGSASSPAPDSRDRPRGVAVGLGLMSGALVAVESNSLPVAGTIIKLGTGQDALEVIFALRETAPSQQPIWGSTTSRTHNQSASTLSTVSSSATTSRKLPLSPLSTARARAKPKPPTTYVPKPKAPEPPLTEAERLLKLAPKLPHTSTKKGRRTVPEAHRKKPLFARDPLPMQPAQPPPLPQAFPASSSDSSTFLDAVSAISPASLGSQSSEDQTSAFLAALGAIDAPSEGHSEQQDGTGGSTINPLLVEALKQLLAAASAAPSNQPRVPTAVDLPRSKSQSTSPTKSQDDDVVLLDKENVNPSAFRRRAERERADAKLHLLTSGSRNAHASGSSDAGMTRVGLGAAAGVENRSRPRQRAAPPPPVVASSDTFPSPARAKKRRLSDFMDERESESKRAFRRDAHRHHRSSERGNSISVENDSSCRHYSRLAQSDSFFHSTSSVFSGPSTSPLRNERHYERQFWDHPGPSMQVQLPQNNGPPVSPKRLGLAVTSASSPVRPSSSLQRPPSKPYKIPDWAKTTTALQPRLSEKALAEKAKEDAANKELKREGRRRKRDLSRQGSTAATHNSSQVPARPEQMTPPRQAQQTEDSHQVSNPTVVPLPIPVVANQECPIFSDSVLPDSRSNTPSPPPRELPKTPPRRPRSDQFTTPVGHSLFTPTPKGFSRETPGALFSPFGAPGSPMPRSSIWAAMVPLHVDDARLSPTIRLAKELDDTMQAAESPQDTLPIASSDTECDEIAHSGSQSDFIEDEDDENATMVNRLRPQWEGLPPSSPPPPSSPLLEPVSQTADLDDLDMPDSDATIEPNERQRDLDALPPSSDPDATFSQEELAAYFDVNAFGNIFEPDPATNLSSQDSALSDLDVFNQFLFHNQSDELNSQNSLASDGFQNPPAQDGMGDFDFAQFWDTVKPLVESHTSSAEGGYQEPVMGMGFDFGPLESLPHDSAHHGGEIDHEKLAEDVHALFSGCLM
ncbi:hypothetical protein HGRIS_002181 [Hohenbuehelia grisea]|uniref:Ams2/SPT21 N-terminal domain-containing protein n=1 Tax=Hohenbuehelia grisea TaxID=104357 RepID=A0ABR3JLQ3_9AGAR